RQVNGSPPRCSSGLSRTRPNDVLRGAEIDQEAPRNRIDTQLDVWCWAERGQKRKRQPTADPTRTGQARVVRQDRSTDLEAHEKRGARNPPYKAHARLSAIGEA